MHRAFALKDLEVVHESVAFHERLRPHPGGHPYEVSLTDLGYQLLQAGRGTPPAQRARGLREPDAPVVSGQAPEGLVAEDLAQVFGAHLQLLVAFAGKAEHGVRTGLYLAVHRTGEVDAEKGEGGVRHRVDQVLCQVASLWS